MGIPPEAADGLSDSRIATIADVREMGTQRLALAILLSLTAAYAALIYLAIGRHLWFDELLTYYIAKAPSMELARKWDLSPPLMHLLARASLRWANGNPVAVRLPSVAAFYLGSLALYGFSARRAGYVFGALPVMLLWYSPTFQYATEARPYALLCCFFCVLLLLWDLAIGTGRQAWVLPAIAFASIGLLNSHVLAPFSLLPFAAAELIRFVRRRKPDYALWGALFLPLSISFLYLPLVRSYQTIGHYPPAFQASLRMGASYYGHTIIDILLCVVVAFAAAWAGVRRLFPAKVEWSSPVTVLFGTVALVPVLLDGIMMHDHAPFWGRYAVTSAVGICWIAAMLVSAAFGNRLRPGLLAVAAAYLLLMGRRVVVPAYLQRVNPRAENVDVFSRIRPNLPIAIASGLTFGEMGQYEKPTLVNRLYYLMDREAALRFANATIFEDLGGFQKTFNLPGKVESLAAFTGGHRHFLVFGTFGYPEDWLLRKLAADGARIVPLGTFETPYKDKTLYEVWLAPDTPA